MHITHDVNKLLQDIRSQPAGSTEMYRLIGLLAEYLREAEKDATAWRALVDTADGGHVHVVGYAVLPPSLKAAAFDYEAPPAEYFSVQEVQVKQAVFRWFTGGDLRDALIDMVSKNDHTQKS